MIISYHLYTVASQGLFAVSSDSKCTPRAQGPDYLSPQSSPVELSKLLLQAQLAVSFLQQNNMTASYRPIKVLLPSPINNSQEARKVNKLSFSFSFSFHFSYPLFSYPFLYFSSFVCLHFTPPGPCRERQLPLLGPPLLCHC